jgi:predicted nucleic acid-binding protein
MKLLLDTNIAIDILSKREGYVDSLAVLRCCEIGRAEAYVSATTVTDLLYILRKRIEPRAVRSAVQTLLTIVDVADVHKSDINAAFASEMPDFEDAVQASCAARIKADYIVTRNVKDFQKSPVPAVLPDGILKSIQPA